MEKLPWEVLKSKTWESIAEYIEIRMRKIRQTDGKHNKKNEELWRLKKLMQEVDPTIKNVGKTFHDHQDAGFDLKKAGDKK